MRCRGLRCAREPHGLRGSFRRLAAHLLPQAKWFADRPEKPGRSSMTLRSAPIRERDVDLPGRVGERQQNLAARELDVEVAGLVAEGHFNVGGKWLRGSLRSDRAPPDLPL